MKQTSIHLRQAVDISCEFISLVPVTEYPANGKQFVSEHNNSVGAALSLPDQVHETHDYAYDDNIALLPYRDPGGSPFMTKYPQ